MENPDTSRKKLVGKVALRALIVLGVMMAGLFLPAGTFLYWQAWVYLAIIFIPGSYILTYLFKHEPDLLIRRMKFSEKREKQKAIMTIFVPFYLLIYLLPGFDFRFGWSSVPVGVALLSGLLVVISYYFTFRVFKENRYASRIIEVDDEQKVIQTGAYAVIRHPMYLSALVFNIFTPVALGSWWAILPAICVIPSYIVRIFDEEKMLLTGLPGYREYCQKIKYRLIPRIW